MSIPPAPPPAKRSIPPPPAKPIAPPQTIGAASGKVFTSAPPTKRKNSIIGIYGTGGIGKSTLAARVPGKTKIIDLDSSIGVIMDTLAGAQIEIVGGIDTWQDLRDALHQDSLWEGTDNVVIDTISRAEELCVAHVLATIRTEKGAKCDRLEDYGFGKGYRHLFDVFLSLFSDVEAHRNAGRNVILVCHDAASKVPNPAGEDFLRYEPRLQNNGSSNLRSKLKEMVDHLFFIGYDVFSKDGKAQGSGSRTIYPVEQGHFMAKSRLLSAPIVYNPGDTALWDALMSETPF